MTEPRSAPVWRREPYRLFFPAGLLLALSGVSHWLALSLGLDQAYRSVFHSIAQIEGFLALFAAGFLFTAIPRRTGTPPPATWQVALGLLLPLATTIAAWFDALGLSQVFWLTFLGTLAVFAGRRLVSKRAQRRPPVSFVWIPIAIGMGAVGSLLTAAAMFGDEWFWVHDLGQLLVLQGLFLGLIVGLGGMVLPLLTRGDAPPDAAGTGADRIALLGHLAAALGLVLSFWLESRVSPVQGFTLRAVVLLILLLRVGKIWRLPSKPGRHRWLVWVSAWMLPLGYGLAAIFPHAAKAGMHVTFLGGFALMALSVGLHVTLAHGGYQALVGGRPWQVPVYGGLLAAATVLRALADFDRPRVLLWLGVSAATFLVGSLAWAALVFPRLRDAKPARAKSGRDPDRELRELREISARSRGRSGGRSIDRGDLHERR